jgi:hypothetical protein
MINKVVKIKPIPKKGGMHEFTLQSSLRRGGLSRVPGTSVIVTPYYDINFKKYHTGLDEESKKINSILDDEERESEKNRIRKLREMLEFETGLELTPRSEYYKNVAAPKEPNSRVGYSLKDGENVFNLAIPEQYITFLWLSNHPDIAPSLEHWEKGLCLPSVNWYVENVEVELESKASKKKEQNKAAVSLESMSETKRKKLAIIIGDLGITTRSLADEVYTTLDDYIKAEGVGLKHIKEFNKLTSLSDDVIESKYLARLLMQEGLLKIFPGGVIRECESCPSIAQSYDELEQLFADPTQQDLYIAYSEKLKNHLSLRYDLI